MIIPDKVYDILKWVTMIVIPALATAYVGLAAVWGWPYAEEIAKTILRTFKKRKPIDTTRQLYAVIEEALSFLPEKERKDAVKSPASAPSRPCAST